MFRIKFLPTLPSLLFSPERPLIHRDLSWLQFNERVLDEARESSHNPLLERVKYLAITATNLDEFFMIRFASLGRSIRSSSRYHKAMNYAVVRRLENIRAEILENVAKFTTRQLETLDIVCRGLSASNIHIVKRTRDSEELMAIGKKIFDSQIMPKLRPPETFEMSKLGRLENLQLGIVSDSLWFTVPRVLPGIYFHEQDGASYYFFLDDLLGTFIGPVVRLTRDADFTAEIAEDDPGSIPDVVRTGLGSRERGAPVRLQYAGDLSSDFLAQAAKSLKLKQGQVLPAPGTVCLHALWSVVNHAPTLAASKDGKLQYPPIVARTPRPLKKKEKGTLFDRLKQNDILLHHPYDSFDAFVSFIEAAATDPSVQSIEQTIYRVDKNSPLIKILKNAAKEKRVRVIIELRARFDESNNLKLAEELRAAGVEVAYGFGKLKLHAKVALITRREAGGDRLYTHLSTGNYNAATARLYTDLAILTSHQEIGQDARVFFDAVMKGQVPQKFKHLVLAPTKLHRRLLAHIQSETEAATRGEKTRIVAKVNALVDETVVEALYGASQAGVKVDLIVRGACSLIPGVPGLSENIRVVSVVDRFLEHSRIYFFESQKAMYFSSADWMPRNFFRRLEIAFPVLDPRIYAYIENILIPTYLSDNLKARELTHQGTWKRKTTRQGPGVRSQLVFEKLATEEYRGTPLQ